MPNSPAGLAALAGHLAGGPAVHVVFEASGGYDMPLLLHLQAEAIPCTRLNPRQVRNYARVKGRLAKTDATLLADFGAAFTPPATPVADPAIGELAGLVRYRGHLLDALDRERMQLDHPKPLYLATIIKARIRALERQVQWLEKGWSRPPLISSAASGS